MRMKGFWLLPLIGLFIAGCGGSGGSNGGGNNGGNGGGLGSNSAATPVYATDALNVGFQHVWVTVYGIDLVTSSGATVAAFSSTSGVTVDVRSLRDSKGQLFELLNAQGVPSGSYTGAQVFLSNTVTITTAANTVSKTYQFAAANSGGTGETELAVTFKTPFMANGTSPLVLDFDLDNWSINAQNQVVASLAVAYTANVNETGRQVDRPIQGVVQNLSGSAGAQTFNLVHDRNDVLQVATNSGTMIANANGAANPALANNEHVFLTGTYVNNVFTADNVIIVNGNAVSDLVHVEGTFSSVSAANGTFVVAEQMCDAALSSTQVTVDTNSSTVFSADGITETQADFFGQLAQYPSAQVLVTGTLTGSTVTATNVSLRVPMGNGSPTLLLVTGSTSNVNAAAGTFTLSVGGWQGMAARQGGSLSVITNSSTYYNLNGAASTEADWFAALTAKTPVVAIGTVSNGTLTADALVIGTKHNSFGH